MSLITRCPACQTLFRVVPDQLRISEGWVRCGSCAEIFDASLHLLAPLASEQEPAQFQAANEQESRVTSMAGTSQDDPMKAPPEAALDPLKPSDESAWSQPSSEFPVWLEPDSQLDVDPADPALGELATPTASDSVPGFVSQEADLPDALPQTDGTLEPFESVVSDEPHAPEVPEIDATASESNHVAAIESIAVETDALQTVVPVSFLESSRQDSAWSKPRVRGALWVLATLLSILLATQLIAQERNRIAAIEPGLRPALLTFCGLLNCTLSPLREIESIAIDSSSFSRIRGDTYRLKFVVKNTATTGLALPSMELTLTDSNEQVVLRRVFSPAALEASMDSLPAGGEWDVSVALALQNTDSPGRVLGYRLLAFYP